MRKFTSAEEIILKYLSSEYKYLTRDRDGIPYIHTSKPVKDNKTGEWRNDFKIYAKFVSILSARQSRIFRFVCIRAKQSFGMGTLAR